jgi:hypothetical protein
MGDRRDTYRVLIGRPERKRPLERSRYRRGNNTEMDIQEIGRGVEWTDMVPDRTKWRALVNAVMNIRVP